MSFGESARLIGRTMNKLPTEAAVKLPLKMPAMILDSGPSNQIAAPPQAVNISRKAIERIRRIMEFTIRCLSFRNRLSTAAVGATRKDRATPVCQGVAESRTLH